MEYVGVMMGGAGEAVAARGAGQAVLRGVDRLLWVIEKAAQWSVQPPIDEYLEPGSTSHLTRPLPWVVFIMLLILMRICREAYNIFAILMGLDEVRPPQIVKYIQSKRRHLRAVKYQGMRSIRSRGRRVGGAGGATQARWWWRAVQAVQSTAAAAASPAADCAAATHNQQEDQVVVVKMVGGKKTRSQRQHENQSSDGGDEDADEDEVYKHFLEEQQTNSGTEDPDFTITDKACAPDTSATSIESHETNNSDYISGQSTPNKENQSPQENQYQLSPGKQSLLENNDKVQFSLENNDKVQSSLENNDTVQFLLDNNDKVLKSVSPDRIAVNGPAKTKLPTPKDSTKQILESERRKSVEYSHGNEAKREKGRETNKDTSGRNRNSPRKSRIANGSPKKISPLKHKSPDAPTVKVTNTEYPEEEHPQSQAKLLLHNKNIRRR